MTQRFKRGQFAEGAIGLARELQRLTEQPPTPVARQYVAPAPVKKDNTLEIFLWVIVCTIGLVGIIWFICWLIERRSARIAREAAELEARRSAVLSSKPTAADADRVFNSYTPQERERIIERHTYHSSYSPGCSTDPLLFYMLLNATMQPHYAYAAPAYYPSYSAPAPSPSYSAPEPERRESSSSSDSWGSSSSSSSYDSGSSSSSDSGSSSSSSDSSGGGGSW